MPARTYDFSNYQGGLESVLGGAAQGFTGVEALVHGLRRRRIVEGQQDAKATTEEQNAVDENARKNAEAGGGSAPAVSATPSAPPAGETPPVNPVTAGGGPGGPSPLAGVSFGEGFRAGQGTPPFSFPPSSSSAPSSPANGSGVSSPAPASDPAAGGQGGGGVMGAVRSLRQRAANYLLGSSPTPGVPSTTFQRTGPSDAMSAENTRAQAMRDVAGIDVAGRSRDVTAEVAGRQAVATTDANARRYEADVRAFTERQGLIRQLRTAGVQGAQAITAQLNDRVHSIEAEMRDPNALSSMATDKTNPNAFNDWYASEQDKLSLANEELRLAAENSAGGVNGTGANPALQRFLGAEPQLQNEMAMRRAALARVTESDPDKVWKRTAIEQAYQQRKAALLGTMLLQGSGAPAAPAAPAAGSGSSNF